jgi:hypothetical protein
VERLGGAVTRDAGTGSERLFRNFRILNGRRSCCAPLPVGRIAKRSGKPPPGQPGPVSRACQRVLVTSQKRCGQRGLASARG